MGSLGPAQPRAACMRGCHSGQVHVHAADLENQLVAAAVTRVCLAPAKTTEPEACLQRALWPDLRTRRTQAQLLTLCTHLLHKTVKLLMHDVSLATCCRPVLFIPPVA